MDFAMLASQKATMLKNRLWRPSIGPKLVHLILAAFGHGTQSI